jgi:hypothetical protein
MDYFFELFSGCRTPGPADDTGAPNTEAGENSNSVNPPTECVLNNGEPSRKAHAVGKKRLRSGERDDEDGTGEENPFRENWRVHISKMIQSIARLADRAQVQAGMLYTA